ncbi:MAG: hypothetical protein UIM53_05695 [Acutalibacteraceae bacterium]|nr:hypothetical protein [Acutalibacteraceae bacterium]
MGYGIDTLNSIRANASADYQARIPVATQENITAIGNALQAYTLAYNEFCELLVNKIGKTLLESKLFKNKLARFKKGTVLTQQDVEEIFIGMAKAEGSYNPAGPNPLGRRELPDIKVIYHRQNRQDYYAISIGDIDFIRVFRSEATFESFMAELINSVYSGAEYDEWVAMKELLGSYDGYFDVQVPAITEDVAAKTATKFVKTLRKIVQDLGFASEKHNKAGVKTWTKAEDLVLLINKDVIAEIDVEVLAKAFNMGKTDIQVEIIPMDDFGSLTDTYGLLVDKDFFRVWDTLSHMEPQRNAQGLFTNYFYHVHQILSLSTFKNAVRLTTKAVTE